MRRVYASSVYSYNGRAPLQDLRGPYPRPTVALWSVTSPARSRCTPGHPGWASEKHRETPGVLGRRGVRSPLEFDPARCQRSTMSGGVPSTSFASESRVAVSPVKATGSSGPPSTST